MSNSFSYVRYDNEANALQKKFRDKCEELEDLAKSSLASPRPKALTLTKLEEAYMWIGKAIRDDQIARTGLVDEQPERRND